MNHSSSTSRRRFLRNSLLAGLATAAAAPFAGLARAAVETAAGSRASSRVALLAGTDHADLVFRNLKVFEPELRRAIGERHIVLKPNNVAIDNPLCATPAECLEGALEFLKSIGKLDHAVIAESAASGPTLDGFANYHYPALAGKYGVKLVDLDAEPVDVIQVFDEKDFRPHPVRMARRLLDPDAFIISATRLKTHDRVVATLSLKNVIVGTAIKEAGFRWGPGGKPGARNDKPIIHGSGFRGINYNLFALAQRLHPHLAILDGVEGMEGNGPVGGTPVDHRVCVVSPDWLAADRVAVELMGIDFAKIGYLNYCAQANLGEADLKKIEIVGEPVAPHVKTYKLNQNVEQQLIWQRSVAG
jgi:uncharacterized protein (DUF362 family)